MITIFAHLLPAKSYLTASKCTVNFTITAFLGYDDGRSASSRN